MKILQSINRGSKLSYVTTYKDAEYKKIGG